jgi:hypothetical protein
VVCILTDMVVLVFVCLDDVFHLFMIEDFAEDIASHANHVRPNFDHQLATAMRSGDQPECATVRMHAE